MAHHEPAPVDPEELKRSYEMWTAFTKFTKWGIISTAAFLIFLGLVFV